MKHRTASTLPWHIRSLARVCDLVPLLAFVVPSIPAIMDRYLDAPTVPIPPVRREQHLS